MRHPVWALLLIAVLLAGCGGAPASTPGAQSSAPAQAAASTPAEEAASAPAEEAASAAPTPAAQTIGSGAVKIRFWAHQNNSFNQATQEIINAFVEQNPDVSVEYETFPFDVFIQTIQTSLPAGTTADIVELPGSYTCRYAIGGQLVPLPDSIMALSVAREQFYAAPLQSFTCDGKLYGLPSEYNLEYGGAYVNQALFEKHGVAYPPQWSSWDAMVADSAKLAEIENDQMSKAGLHFTNGDQLFTYLLSGILEQGGTYFAEDGKHFTFDTPQARATIQKMVDMVETSKVVDPVLFNGESNWVGEAFAQGNVGVAVLGSWYGGEAKITHPELKFDYVKIPPMFGDQAKFVSAGGWGNVVSKNSQHPDVAWKLAAFMAADEQNALAFNSTTGTIPALKAVVENPGPLVEKAPFLEATFDLLPNGQYQGELTDANQLAYEIIYPALLDAMQGIITVDDAALQIHEEANAMVDAAR